MKTTFYLDGKRISRKALKAMIGEERLNRMLRDAKESFMEDPRVQNDFYIGEGHMLTIKFD